MSYDYDALVAEIEHHRKEAGVVGSERGAEEMMLDELQKAVDAYGRLSGHCPMTPMLWMQYGRDTGLLVERLLLLDTTQQDEKEEEEEEKKNQQEATGTKATRRAKRESKQAQESVLELGIAEFPGCALLRREYLELLLHREEEEEEGKEEAVSKDEQDDDKDVGEENREGGIESALQDALQCVGCGSHRKTDDEHVAAIYRLQLDYYMKRWWKGKQDRHWRGKILESLSRRAQTPMSEANDDFWDDLDHCRHESFSLTDEEREEIELARRFASRHFGPLAPLEEDVHIAMTLEDVVPNKENDHEENPRRLMGHGAAATAQAFVKYARATMGHWTRTRKRIEAAQRKGPQHAAADDKEDDHHHHDDAANTQNEDAVLERIWHYMILGIFERAVSECPTVESVWTAYLHHLALVVAHEEKKKKKNQDAAMATRFWTVACRAVRNCPYSVPLFGWKMKAMSSKAAVFDPDQVSAVVREALDAKFITVPQSHLDLYLLATRQIQRHILSLLSRSTTTVDYDQADVGEKKPRKRKRANKAHDDGDSDHDNDDEMNPAHSVALGSNTPIPDETLQEVDDVAEDLRDLYKEADSYFRKTFTKWTEGRAILWRERTLVEAYILLPVFGGAAVAIQHFEKLLRIHQPTHPDDWMAYIRYLEGRTTAPSRSCADDDDDKKVPTGASVSHMRRLRGLYQKALVSVKRAGAASCAQEPSQNTTVYERRDMDVALHGLCHAYLNFERRFGSEQTYAQATKTVRSKLAAAEPENDTLAVPPKAAANETVAQDEKPTQHAEPSKKVNLKVEKSRQDQHKVRVGAMEYPAHPFTVHVGNVSAETEDMDLVDFFKHKCGAVVHARVLRHKGGASKGSALVQFEEREAVALALALDGQEEVNDKTLEVRRSHMPAVAVVPPGMHRVNPKGQGRNSKRNEKRKMERESQTTAPTKRKRGDGPKDAEPTESQSTVANEESGVLAFRPRGLQNKGRNPKAKIDV